MDKSQYGLGLMSGTSLDGLDIALCKFDKQNSLYQFEICETHEISYSQDFKSRLDQASDLDAYEFMELDHNFASFCADHVNDFLKNVKVKPDFIASHGHTIFHDPSKGFSTQIGNGAVIAAKTGITVVSDFRSLDTALGGQGAPLVPVGDQLLFHDFDACLNLGGIANISYQDGGKRVAYDISLCNIPLNFLARKLGYSFDPQGELAAKGELVVELLQKLEHIDYYQQSPPKSLGKESFLQSVLPLILSFNCSENDLLRTITEHIAIQVAKAIPEKGKLLITGGGAFNTFLIDLIRKKSNAEIVIPDTRLIKFKEAIIFGFLGYLRLHHQNNSLSSVTGASQDSCGGAVYFMH